MKAWHPIRNMRQQRIKRDIHNDAIRLQAMRLALEDMTIQHKITYAPRPPAPRPERLTLTFISPDGREYMLYYPLNGGRGWYDNIPPWVQEIIRQDRGTMQMRIDLGYQDGNS